MQLPFFQEQNAGLLKSGYLLEVATMTGFTVQCKNFQLYPFTLTLVLLNKLRCPAHF